MRWIVASLVLSSLVAALFFVRPGELERRPEEISRWSICDVRLGELSSLTNSRIGSPQATGFISLSRHDGMPSTIYSIPNGTLEVGHEAGRVASVVGPSLEFNGQIVAGKGMIRQKVRALLGTPRYDGQSMDAFTKEGITVWCDYNEISEAVRFTLFQAKPVEYR